MQDSFDDVFLLDLLSVLDIVVFGLVVLCTLLAVLYGHRLRGGSKQASVAVASSPSDSSLLDLLLMGRRLTLPLFIATLVATWYGGIFGVTQIAFESGLYNFITQGVFWYITYLIFAFVLVQRVRSFEAVTLPDLIEKMFGSYSRVVAAVFNFLNVLPIVYAISLGLLLQALFGGPLILQVSLGVGLVVLYSMLGGFRAVVFSDLVQFFVMCLGVFLVLMFSIFSFGGWSFLQANLPASHFEVTGGHGWLTLFVWGFIALATLVDPNFYQRCFAADQTRTARLGILLSTCIWIGFDICTTAGAMYARAVMPEADSSSAYLLYALQLLPEGLRGLILGGILATILSTMDSYLFIAGTSLSYDLVPKALRGRISYHYFGIIAVGVLSVFLSASFEGDIREVWKTFGSYSAACLLLPVLYAYAFPGRISDRQFVFACLLGATGTTLWRFWERSGFWAEIDEIYAGFFATSFGLVLGALCRLVFRVCVSREDPSASSKNLQ